MLLVIMMMKSLVMMMRIISYYTDAIQFSFVTRRHSRTFSVAIKAPHGMKQHSIKRKGFGGEPNP